MNILARRQQFVTALVAVLLGETVQLGQLFRRQRTAHALVPRLAGTANHRNIRVVNVFPGCIHRQSAFPVMLFRFFLIASLQHGMQKPRRNATLT